MQSTSQVHTPQQVLDFLILAFNQKNSSPLIIFLSGSMGSGKTTLTDYLVQKILGVDASSPTYSLMNEYQKKMDGGFESNTVISVNRIQHWDLYRIQSQNELEDSGFWHHVNSNEADIVFIEWPDLTKNILIPDLIISIFGSGTENRIYEIIQKK